MKNSGRHWAEQGYKNKDYIFSYSAASIATIVHQNPEIDYRILTDDIALLKSKLDEYEFGYQASKLTLLYMKHQIEEWKSLGHCFWPLIMSMDYMCESNKNKRVIKLDNDLTALKPLDDKFFSHQGSHVWKFERQCSGGREYWGERLCAREAFGTDNFAGYNTGILSVDIVNQNIVHEISELYLRASSVDISSVSYFPDNPTVKAKTWSCADQTSNNFWFHKNNIPIMETYEYFNHHCYVNSKEGVLEGAKHLLKLK